jgi:hypothetical protein
VTKGKDLATVEAGGEVAIFDYGADAGSGYENQSAKDISIPFLNVLQSNSPICGEEDSVARPGMLMNSVTQELFSGKDGIPFVPVTTRHSFVEWVPRDAGGGIVGEHAIDSQVVADARARNGGALGKLKTSNGNDLIETFTIIGLQLTEDGDIAGPMIVANTSTKIKPYKGLMTRLRTYLHPAPGGRKVQPPLFAHKVRIATFKDKNTKGEFFNFVFNPLNGDVAKSLNAPDSPVMAAARELKTAFETGAVRAATETQSNGDGRNDGDDVPF